jgi:drug/metabolite transporter (DMT)-like permease
VLQSAHVKVVLLALLNGALVSGGGALQRLNGERHGHPVWSVWILLAMLLMGPSFLVSNWAYSIGGKMSLFVPVTAVTYVFSLILAKVAFKETVDWLQWVGCGFVVVGIAISARPK